MKRLSALEIAGLVLGAVLFFVGLAAVISPKPGIVQHFTNSDTGTSVRTETEVVSATGSRVYGIMAMLLGVGIIALAVYHKRR